MRPKTGGVIFTYDFSNTPTAIFPWRCFYCVWEIMRKILLLFMLITVSANAATMCVPDFSQMSDKCTVVSYTKNTWTVNCNGVEVSGIAIPGRGAYASFAYDIEEIVDFISLCNCLMQHPVVGQYLLPLPEPSMCSEWYGMSCGQFCANVFVPRCGFSKCNPYADLGISCTQGSEGAGS